MRIGIVQSGYEMLPLFQFLSDYDHEYHVFCDWSHWPRGDKSPRLREERIGVAMEYLADKVDVLIVPPMTELKTESWKLKAQILPLFETYVLEYALKYSIVGKIWLLCDSADIDESQGLVEKIATGYNLTEQQQAMSSPQPSSKESGRTHFNSAFPMWKREVRMWKYFMTTYGKRDWMVRKTLKYDLRYFHDAGVDTLIPLDRGMLFWQKIIRQRINWKKMRFHGLDAVQDCFEQVTESHKLKAWSYGVTLYCTDEPKQLLEERKWMDILGRGKSSEVKVVRV